jgi:hypothetical protein
MALEESGESAGKTTAETTERPSAPGTAVAKVRQPHGGALNAGGTPGNKGGRPPSAIRQACRGDFDQLRGKLVTIARSRKALDRDRIRAIDVLGKYGLGEQQFAASDVRYALEQTTETIREMLPPAQAEALLSAISSFWLGI